MGGIVDGSGDDVEVISMSLDYMLSTQIDMVRMNNFTLIPIAGLAGNGSDQHSVERPDRPVLAERNWYVWFGM